MSGTIKKRKFFYVSEEATKKNKEGGKLEIKENLGVKTKEKPVTEARKTIKEKVSALGEKLGLKRETTGAPTKEEVSVAEKESTKEKSISEKAKEKAAEKEEAAKEEEKVKEEKATKEAEAKSKLEAQLKDPKFKDKLEAITGKKTESFGTKPTEATIKNEVTKKIDDLKAKADEKAKEKAQKEKDDLIKKNQELTSGKKDLLNNNIKGLKDRFDDALSKFRKKSDKPPRDPSEIIKEKEAKDNAEKERAKEKDHEDARTKTRADENDHATNEAHARDEAAKERDPLKKGEKDPRDDEKVIEKEAKDNAEKERAKEKEHEKEREKAREKESEKATRESEGRDEAAKEHDPLKKGEKDPRDDEKLKEKEAKDKAEKERTKEKEHEKEREHTREDERDHASRLNDLLGILPLGGPNIHFPFFPPLGPGGPGGPQATVTPPFYDISYPPPPPELPPPYIIPTPRITAVAPVAAAAPAAAPAEGPEGPEGPEEGTITFTLQNQPTQDIQILIQSLSDDLEFNTNILNFPLSAWDTPVSIKYNCDLDTDIPPEDRVIHKVKRSIPKKPIVKQVPTIYQQYPLTQDLLNTQKSYVRKILKKPVQTLEEALREIDKKVEKKEEFDIMIGGDNDIIPTYADRFYRLLDIVEPSLEYEDNDIIPTYDDRLYKLVDIVIPTFIGGQNDEDLIAQLDYTTIASEISAADLSDNLVASIQYTLQQDISSELNIQIIIDSDTWVIEPPMLTFDTQTNNVETYFFSQNVYQVLEDLHTQSKANDISNKFQDYVDNYQETTLHQIENEHQQGLQNAQDVYDKTYQNSLDETQQQINDAQELLGQIGGASKKKKKYIYLNLLRNRSRKIKK